MATLLAATTPVSYMCRVCLCDREVVLPGVAHKVMKTQNPISIYGEISASHLGAP